MRIGHVLLQLHPSTGASAPPDSANGAKVFRIQPTKLRPKAEKEPAKRNIATCTIANDVERIAPSASPPMRAPYNSHRQIRLILTQPPGTFTAAAQPEALAPTVRWCVCRNVHPSVA